MKRKIRKDRVFFLTLIIATIIYQPFLVIDTYHVRGYFAIGGEWLIIPMICLVWGFTENLREKL